MWQNIVSVVLYGSALVGIVCYQYILPTKIRAFVIWCTVYALGDLVLHLFYKFIPNGVLVPIVYCSLDPFEYFTFYWVFIFKSPSAKHIRIIGFLLFLILTGFCINQLGFHLQDRSSANNSFLLKSIFILSIVLYYFWQLLTSNKIVELKTEPLFWIATGALFYYLGNVISTGFFHRIFSSSEQIAVVLYRLNYILEILLFGFYVKSFLISSRKNRQ